MRFQYRGHFPTSILPDGETVSATGDGSLACIVWHEDGALRINPGDWIVTRAGKLHRVELVKA